MGSRTTMKYNVVLRDIICKYKNNKEASVELYERSRQKLLLIIMLLISILYEIITIVMLLF